VIGASPGEVLMETQVILLAVDSDPGDPLDPSLVRDLLGVTLAEARVASLVGTGLSPRHVAERLGITEETARTALKRTFSKTGVSRQSELVTMMARLMRR
jgi:DNA-binding CsgD family transcriptional regulator